MNKQIRNSLLRDLALTGGINVVLFYIHNVQSTYNPKSTNNEASLVLHKMPEYLD
jgi:hypothetical protein